MIEIFGKHYFLDLDAVIEKCKIYETPKVTKSKKSEPQIDDEDKLEINVFKYEIIKMMVDRVLNEIDDMDEEMGIFAQNSSTVSFRLAFNTLLKYEIIIEETE
jgi:hypothetical protein